MLAPAQAAPKLPADVAQWYPLNEQCRYGSPDRPEDETVKICAKADELAAKLEKQGYCMYGHGVVGVSSKDKKHCYERKSLQQQ
jgi:hypothetical protein